MELKIGDKVKLRDRNIAEAHNGGVWGVVGEVIEIVDDGTPIQRVTVEFPDLEPIVGMHVGQFELA